jgi:glycosyltransferase involved in cell wall biosynthesis
MWHFHNLPEDSKRLHIQGSARSLPTIESDVQESILRSVSVVVPVYRSAVTLPTLVAQLGQVLSAYGSPFEVILVNDGSPDDSAQVIAALVAAHSWLRGISMMRNYGQHNALLCGIRTARYDVIVTIDDDLQHPPEEIPKLLARLDAGADVVYGTPQRAEHQLWRNLASWITKLVLQGAMGAHNATRVSAFRAFRTPLRAAFAEFRGPFVSIDVLLTWATTRFDAVDVRHEPRREGESNYTFRKLLTHAMDMVTGFSVVPLKWASILGFACATLGLILFLYVIVRYVIEGGSVPGFPFLASVVVLFSGAQLVCLGVFGEYLARIHFRSMNKPSYVVSKDSQEATLEETR